MLARRRLATDAGENSLRGAALANGDGDGAARGAGGCAVTAAAVMPADTAALERALSGPRGGARSAGRSLLQEALVCVAAFRRQPDPPLERRPPRRDARFREPAPAVSTARAHRPAREAFAAERPRGAARRRRWRRRRSSACSPRGRARRPREVRPQRAHLPPARPADHRASARRGRRPPPRPRRATATTSLPLAASPGELTHLRAERGLRAAAAAVAAERRYLFAQLREFVSARARRAPTVRAGAARGGGAEARSRRRPERRRREVVERFRGALLPSRRAAARATGQAGPQTRARWRWTTQCWLAAEAEEPGLVWRRIKRFVGDGMSERMSSCTAK